MNAAPDDNDATAVFAAGLKKIQHAKSRFKWAKEKLVACDEYARRHNAAEDEIMEDRKGILENIAATRRDVVSALRCLGINEVFE